MPAARTSLGSLMPAPRCPLSPRPPFGCPTLSRHGAPAAPRRRSGQVSELWSERMTQRNDYSGAFDPGFDYEDLSREALVRLVREYGLIVHLLDRSMCAAIGLRYGAVVVKELALEEWG